LWKLDRRTGRFLGFKEMVAQTIWDSIDPKTGVPRYRADIYEMKIGKPISICPSTEGGNTGQAMTNTAPAGLLIAPLSQSCMDFTARDVALTEGAGGSGGDRVFKTMPRRHENGGQHDALRVG